MQLLLNLILISLTIAVICGVILIAIPLFKISNFFRRSKRPIFIIESDDDQQWFLQNSGNSECKVVDIFLESDMTYFESLNGVSFAPNQRVLLKLPKKESNSGQITIRYNDTTNNKYYEQKFSLNNL